MNDYRVRFTAVSGGPLVSDAGTRLAAALEGMPGMESIEETAQDRRRRRVTATFWIKVRLGMADAARDGSRLAKEALRAAGMEDAQLLELSVSWRPRRRAPAGKTA